MEMEFDMNLMLILLLKEALVLMLQVGNWIAMETVFLIRKILKETRLQVPW